MSIRLKLIIIYFVTLTVSVVTIGFLSFGITVNFFDNFSQEIFDNDDVEEVIETGMKVMVDIAYTLEHDRNKILDEGYQADLSERLVPLNVLFGVEKDGELVYFSSSIHSEEITSNLQTIVYSQAHHGPGQGDGQYLSIDDSPYFVMRRGIDFESENDGYIYMVMDLSNIEYTAKDYFLDLLKVFITVFLIAVVVFLLVITKMIIKPLRKLEEGTQKIKNGNLDFNMTSASRDEFGRVCNSFEKMRVELKSSIEKQIQYEESRKELVSNISHDLKTPITAIKGYSQGILDGVANTDEKQDKYLQVIYSKSKEMDRLIDQLLLFSKLDLDRLHFDIKRVKAKAYFDRLVEDIEVELLVKEIKLSYKNGIDEETFVELDEQNLRRVLANIVQNSVKYMDKDEKTIDICLTENSEMIQGCVRDNGIGIKGDEIEQIFDKFYRCDKARNTEIGGSGIGLAISKQIVDRHEGKIWAESEYGEYTAIYFTLKKALGGQ